MKTILYFLFFAIIGIQLFSFKNQAASGKKVIVTDTIQVEGNCNMCKERIENAALIKGVKKAEWNKQIHQLVVVYDSTKTTMELIQKSIAEAGHDTPLYKAPDDVYSRLPACCLYREEGAHTH